MIFMLLEKAPQPSPELIKEWTSADDRTKERIVRQLIQGYSGKSRIMAPVIDSFRHACYNFGIDPNKNGFINFYDTLSGVIPFNDNVDNCLNELVKCVMNGSVKMPQLEGKGQGAEYQRQYLLDPSLYHRNAKDFAYTVKAFELVSNPDKVSRYFKDLSDVSIDAFYDDKGNIKPAGSPQTADDTDTIFGTIESWGQHGDNEIKQHKVSNPSQPRLTKSLLRNAPKYNTLDEVPYKECEDGNVIFVKFLKHNPSGPDLKNDYVNSYYQYYDNAWHKISKL